MGKGLTGFEVTRAVCAESVVTRWGLTSRISINTHMPSYNVDPKSQCMVGNQEKISAIPALNDWLAILHFASWRRFTNCCPQKVVSL